MVAPTTLEAYRIKGSTMIVPDKQDKIRMVERGWNRVFATVKLCISATGEPSSVELVKASGLPHWDAWIREAVSDWRYKPFEINGTPQPVCTAVTFVYNQTNPQQ